MNNFQNNVRTYESEGMLHLSIGENFNYSPTSLLSYLRSKAHLQILSKKSWFLTDDFQAEFKYKDHIFILYTPLDSVDISPLSNQTPEELTTELYTEIKKYRSVSAIDWLCTWIYLLSLPSSYKPKNV